MYAFKCSGRIMLAFFCSAFLPPLLLKHISVKYSSITCFQPYFMVFFFLLISDVFSSHPVMCRSVL